MNFKVPTEIVKLPSQGLLYPEGHPLRSGEVEMKYMTAAEEDILTNESHIKSGKVLNKVVESLLVDKSIKIDDFLSGDFLAIIFSLRILSYGKMYKVYHEGEEYDVDLTKIGYKEINPELLKEGNSFSLTLNKSKNEVTFKLMTMKDDDMLEKERKGYLKIGKGASKRSTTYLIHIITSVNGSTEEKDIRNFVNNYLLAEDARQIRTAYNAVEPGIDLSLEVENKLGETRIVEVSMGVDFFWPDAGI